LVELNWVCTNNSIKYGVLLFKLLELKKNIKNEITSLNIKSLETLSLNIPI